MAGVDFGHDRNFQSFQDAPGLGQQHFWTGVIEGVEKQGLLQILFEDVQNLHVEIGFARLQGFDGGLTDMAVPAAVMVEIGKQTDGVVDAKNGLKGAQHDIVVIAPSVRPRPSCSWHP